ncbi:glutathione S-transferase N-terminal domain-containing protein [Craterilacuibacter sp.]|uniref:glutathione S-transferase N-terminal domain-containing protein n=1 Tax=Craterilacuibacter sp. TaxID=2870909 RepID=UPI003F36458B
MKLLVSPTSPFARKVRIVLAEKKIECPIQIEHPWQADSAISDYNPLGQVPALELDDGSVLFDSRVIAEYLDSISPVSRLYPQERRVLIDTRRWEALADGICNAAVAIVIEKRRPADKQSEEWITHQHAKIVRGLAAMNCDLGERLWCNGEAYSIADIAVGCALDYLGLRFSELDWKTSHPKLTALHEKLSTRPSFSDTLPA